jgi:hypothetical protein
MAVKVHVEIFIVVTPCSIVVGYQRFRSLCCLHLQGEDGGSMDCNTTRRHRAKEFDLEVLLLLLIFLSSE